MKKIVIAGIGEILWDVLADIEELGGAPVNFAYHTNALGAEGVAISTVGDDKRGEAALQQLKSRGVTTECVSVVSGAVTGYVKADIDDQGVATYTFPDDVAWDAIVINEKAREAAKRLDAVCFGSLGQRSQRSRQAIQGFLKGLDKKVIKVFDLNIRQNFYSREIIEHSLEIADVLKLNDDEIVVIKKMFDLDGTAEQVLRKLVDRFGLMLCVLTRGGHGSLLVTANNVSEHAGYNADVVDTIGAGDSFTASTIIGLLQKKDLDAINDHANRIAAYVCSQQGAMPPVPPQYRLI